MPTPDPLVCQAYCDDCVTSKGCWADATVYGDAEDQICLAACYTTCESTLGSSSTLCSCAHNFCVIGCPANCNGMDATYKKCNHDCINKASDAKSVMECYTQCELCVTDKGCWATATYGDSDD